MSETPSSSCISTKLARIAELAKRAPDMAFTTLAHHIDVDWLREAYHRTRKDSAVGVDEQTASEYAVDLEANLESLLQRAKSGSYHAPPVRRDGGRGIGAPHSTREAGEPTPGDPVEGRGCRTTEPWEGKMPETPSSPCISTKLARIAELAKKAPNMAFTTLAHYIDVDWLREAYHRTRKDGAAGIDEQTASEYAVDLEANLESLLQRAKSGSYHAPPVRRVWIPKSDGKQMRPIGIPTFESNRLLLNTEASWKPNLPL